MSLCLRALQIDRALRWTCWCNGIASHAVDSGFLWRDSASNLIRIAAHIRAQKQRTATQLDPSSGRSCFSWIWTSHELRSNFFSIAMFPLPSIYQDLSEVCGLQFQPVRPKQIICYHRRGNWLSLGSIIKRYSFFFSTFRRLGASAEINSGAMQAILPSRVGYWDRGRHQYQTWVSK